MSDDDPDTDLRSRGALTRERKAEEKRLAALATALVGLSNRQLGKLDLDEELGDAVAEARRIRTHGARARQLRIVRRELRGSDSLAIADAVDDLVNPHGRLSPAARRAKGWVDRFLDEGNAAVEDFLADHEHADRQRLRGLIRNANNADANNADANRAAKARKTLTATIQTLIQEAES